jgi:hypothetical protein
MWHMMVWGVVALLFGTWTLACLGVHWLLTGPDWNGAGVGAWVDWLAQWRIPLWLTDWLPMASITALKTWLTAMGPWLESLLAQAPALLAWLVPLLWVGWLVGTVLLAVLGVAGSVLVVALRRQAPA